MLKLDHFYIKVTDLNKAIKFYQMILGKKISHKEGNRWADFDSNDGIYLGIFNATNDNETFKAGDNVTLALNKVFRTKKNNGYCLSLPAIRLLLFSV
jgi:predicted enzyme related to lactoylglutathione lyase